MYSFINCTSRRARRTKSITPEGSVRGSFRGSVWPSGREVGAQTAPRFLLLIIVWVCCASLRLPQGAATAQNVLKLVHIPDPAPPPTSPTSTLTTSPTSAVPRQCVAEFPPGVRRVQPRSKNPKNGTKKIKMDQRILKMELQACVGKLAF